MPLRLSYLAVSSVFTVMRLLPVSSTDKDIEILALRHQLAVLERQVDRPRLTDTDCVLLAALLHRLPRVQLRQLPLIVSPDTIMRWHRDLLRRRHTKRSRRRHPGRPPTRRSVQALVLRLARGNSSWGYRRIHGELVGLGITLAPSTVWEILKQHGIEPAQTVTTSPGRREFETFFNGHRPHRSLHGAAPLRPRPHPVTDPDRLDHLDIHRRDRLGGALHEYSHAA